MIILLLFVVNSLLTINILGIKFFNCSIVYN
jgi:hypothetical protein